MKKQITRIEQLRANKIARTAGYGKATEIIHGNVDKVVRHRPYGFSTYSGKFFPHITTTRWFGGGCYSPAKTIVEINANTNV